MAGSEKTMNKQRVALFVRITEEIKSKLVAKAKAEDRSLASLCKEILGESVKDENEQDLRRH
jgi:predicted HicB family RNase H-like nuclease|tara:strand:+ start:421 stop:606 length:186 start_codon:yes stop_codon:yes gene_type:complete